MPASDTNRPGPWVLHKSGFEDVAISSNCSPLTPKIHFTDPRLNHPDLPLSCGASTHSSPRGLARIS